MNQLVLFVKQKSIFIVIILSFIFCGLYFIKNRKKINSSIISVIILDILHTIFFLASCKALLYVEYGIVNTFTNLPKININGGYSFYGNLYIMPLFYVIYALITKKDIKKVLDFATPAILISAFCARLNCVISGCCIGRSLFGTNYLFPTREIELITYGIIMLVILYKQSENKLIKGTAFPFYLIVYGIVRAIEEPFRANFKTDTIHFAFIHCTIAIIVGTILYFIFVKQHKNKINNKENEEQYEELNAEKNQKKDNKVVK